MRELDTHTFDVALVDWELPDMKGSDLLKTYSFDIENFMPLIVLTSHDESDFIKTAFDLGAFDYLRKPPNIVELHARIRSALRFRDLQRKLSELAIRDPLTGLYNRRYFDDSGARILAESQIAKEDFSLAIIDIDHFKKINDQWGHDVGDLVLKQMSRHISGRIRMGNILCRLGGEEFGILFKGLNSETAKIVVARLLKEVKDAQWGPRNNTFEVTFSCGITSRSGDESLSEMFKKADNALYVAKQNGRKQVLVHGEEPACAA